MTAKRWLLVILLGAIAFAIIRPSVGYVTLSRSAGTGDDKVSVSIRRPWYPIPRSIVVTFPETAGGLIFEDPHTLSSQALPFTMRYSDGSEKRAAAWAVVINPAFERPELGEFVLAVSIEGEVTEFQLPHFEDFDLMLTETTLNAVAGFDGSAFVIGELPGDSGAADPVLLEANTVNGSLRITKDTDAVAWGDLIQRIAPLSIEVEQLCAARRIHVTRLVEDVGSSCNQ